MVDNTEKEWPRQVIDIELMEEELKKYNVNLRDEFTKVLAQNEHIAKAYKKRFQQQRFLTILGAVYADDTIYNDKEKEKHLLKLKKYYHQEKKKSKKGNYQYISLTTAEFYCNLLDAVQSQIEQDYPGIKLPTEEIGKPKAREEITKENTGGKGKTKEDDKEKTPKDIEDKKSYEYHILDLSKLDFVSADQMHQYCQEVLSSMVNGKTTTQKDQLVKLIADIEYAYGYSANVNDDMRIKTHTDKVRNFVSYSEGSSLTKEKQELYVNFLDNLEKKIKENHPDHDIEKEEIRVLWPTEKGQADDDNHDDVIIHDDDDDNHDDDNKKEALRTYTSDEWNQMITIASKTAVNSAAGIEEGIAASALRDVMGDKFPKNWNDMTLDEQESIIKNLSPVQVSQFNIKVTELGKKLAETLPPNFLVLMADNTDRALKSNKLSEEEKSSLAEQRNIIIKAMVSQIPQVGTELTIDNLNAAGVYDGFNSMLNYLEKNQDNMPEGVTLAQEQMNNVRDIIEKAITEYDKEHGLENIDKKSAGGINKAYDYLQKEVKDIIKNNSFEELLDNDTKEIFNSLEFPTTNDDNGNEISSEENKKLFIEAILHSAAQKTAVEHNNKSKKEIIEAFKKQLAETTILETADVILAQEAINAAKGDHSSFNDEKDIESKKTKIKQYIETKAKKVSISKEALAGYFAAKVNKQSLFVNRLATKVNNRNVAVLRKMWRPFQKIDQTCINRFGKFYTLPKAILSNQAKNLPWTLGMAAARVAAFSVAATPCGWAAVAAYGVVSAGATWWRMRKNYKERKKHDPSLTVGKFFKQNWSGILLSAVGTAASVVPGLAASVEGLQGAVDAMKDCGMLAQTNIPVAESLGMTNLSVAMVGAGMVDSTIRGTLAQCRDGESFGKALIFGTLTSTISTAAGIGMGIGCAQACNAVLDTGMNLVGDTRTIDGTDGDLSRNVSMDELNQRIDAAGLRDEVNALHSGTLNQEEYRTTLEIIQETLSKEGLNLTASENGEVTLRWSETITEVTDAAKAYAEDTVKYWTSSNPDVYEQNIETLKPIVEAYNAEHPNTPLDIHRAYHTMLLMGARAVAADVDTLQNHVNGGGTVDCKGLHTAITDNHIAKHGEWNVSIEDAQAVRATTDSNGIMNADAVSKVIDTVAAVEKHVSNVGEVGQNEDTRGGAHTDGYLYQNATKSSSGEHIHVDEGGTLFDSYVDGKDAHETKTINSSENFEVTQKQEQIYMPLNAEVLVFNQTQGLAKIEGNNARAVNEDAATRKTLDMSSTKRSTTKEDDKPLNQSHEKKANFFSRLFGKNKSSSK